MHCVMGCGSIKLRRRKNGLYVCRLHGPVGPRPRIEALQWRVSLAKRNEIMAKLAQAGISSREDYWTKLADLVQQVRAESEQQGQRPRPTSNSEGTLR